MGYSLWEWIHTSACPLAKGAAIKEGQFEIDWSLAALLPGQSVSRTNNALFSLAAFALQTISFTAILMFPLVVSSFFQVVLSFSGGQSEIRLRPKLRSSGARRGF